jgi:Signal recognition particle GTPase
MIDDRPQIILICGVTGSGKTTFRDCYKNSFLQSLPLASLSKGLSTGGSFCCETNLTNKTQFALLEKAERQGYKIKAYYLFTGKLLSLARARIRNISKGEPFDEALFKRTYESSYKGLIDLYDYTEVIFFIRNQSSFEFLSAYEPSSTSKPAFSRMVKQIKTSVDKLA